VIYLDNAATSFPKPPEMLTAITRFATEIGASPGRSAHRAAAAAGREVFQARERLAELLNIPDSARIVFTANVTAALNLALLGLVTTGERVLTTALEHNSVMRPLRRLEAEGHISIDIIPAAADGTMDRNALCRLLDRHSYRLAVLNHGSNVIGTICPLAEIVPLLRESVAVIVIDGAQTAGCLPVDVQQLDIDVFCFTGHKGLWGPPGIGGAWLREGIDPRPLLTGGTGSRSEDEYQPEFLPDRYESGTPNTWGIVGLGTAVKEILHLGVNTIHQRELELVTRLQAGLAAIDGVQIYGPGAGADRLPVLSFNLAGMAPSTVGLRLDREFGIMCRVGLHCAPAAHHAIGTFPRGTVRLAPGWFTTAEEIEQTIAAVAEIAANTQTTR
jgi:cysteine desulfurase family protein